MRSVTLNFTFPNYEDYGYGIFLLDDKSREYVLKNIQSEKDPFLRSMMWGSLWDSVREAELDPKVYVELVVKNLATEQDETIIQSLLGRVGTAMNYYLPDAGGTAIASPRQGTPTPCSTAYSTPRPPDSGSLSTGRSSQPPRPQRAARF
ncbi:MAG: ERAP1-like C-terminal domain-containing protein [Chloracidobacterium sp.]|nr:ERAP1-like C-terminal domain-containing protein [Chloracidobacterium sp.]